ncbi:MAG: phosphoribosylaminoimidazolesuccinocarboxamide synthase [Candidatus Aenigmarchaeota archaeon]|nr:phosphoribosylaminoimidazolesuccinocarboxamide synthase [Candidatus Aenigmarchaeota archaeon]
MGSVKDVMVIKDPTEKEFGVGVFDFRDDYSVFDYGHKGPMPNTIPFKGECLCRMATWNFEQLEKIGIKTHFLKFIEPNKMGVNIVRVLYPGKDEITTETTNYLIPLEIVFRNSLPAGSSVFRALDSGELTLEDIGLDHKPEPGEKLEEPILDITTKLEATDRRVKWDEAKKMSGLSDEDVEKIKEFTFKINDFLTEKAKELGLDHADGKIEVGFGPNRELVLLDVCGTLDENRFLLNGFHISKQVLRDYYMKTPWFSALEEAKKSKPKEEWPDPEKLPEELVTGVSNMYKAAYEAWSGNKIWNVSLEDSVNTVRKFL